MNINELEIIKELEKFGQSVGNMWNIPHKTGEFLNLMVKITKPRTILEIGTSNGYSTIWLGFAAREVGAKIITSEISQERYRMAKENFRKAGLEDIIEAHHADAHEIIKQYAGPFDIIFLDAWKSYYKEYFDLFFPKLSKGGIIFADNAASHADDMAEYLNEVRNNPEIQSVLIPIGSGVEMSYRIP